MLVGAQFTLDGSPVGDLSTLPNFAVGISLEFDSGEEANAKVIGNFTTDGHDVGAITAPDQANGIQVNFEQSGQGLRLTQWNWTQGAKPIAQQGGTAPKGANDFHITLPKTGRVKKALWSSDPEKVSPNQPFEPNLSIPPGGANDFHFGDEDKFPWNVPSDPVIRDLIDRPMSAIRPHLPRGYKYILLIAGAQVATEVLVDTGTAASGSKYLLLPKVMAPTGFAGTIGVNEFPSEPIMASAWSGLVRRYSNQDFGLASWRLAAIRARGGHDIVLALDEVRRLKPTALVVHYFGHGDADEFNAYEGGRPFLTMTGTSGATRDLLDKATNTIKKMLVEIPTEYRRDTYHTDEIVSYLKLIFGTIPVTFIVDGCLQAPVLSDQARHCDIVVAADCRWQETNRAVFSDLWSSRAVPECFRPDGPPSKEQLASVLSDINTAFEHWARPGIDDAHCPRAVDPRPFQRASHTKPRNPWD